MEALALYRQALSLSRAELARRIKTSRANVTRWENGTRKPSPDKLKDIEAVTGIPRQKLRPDLFEART
jgi:transcriptional regulator with XRE-family HTH domain